MERWRTRLGLTAALSLFGGVVVACGSDEGTDTITAERFPSAYAQALCGSLQHCCDENQVAENFASCTSGWKSYVEKLLGATAALTNYEPRTAKACVDAIRAAGSVSCQPIPGSISDARATCAQIFVGKKPIGAACSTAAECAPRPGGKAVVAVPPKARRGRAAPIGAPLRDHRAGVHALRCSVGAGWTNASSTANVPLELRSRFVLRAQNAGSARRSASSAPTAFRARARRVACARRPAPTRASASRPRRSVAH
ncbi:MAG: hypothetical protein U0235_15465 [Polyangiaceae bacterium]